MRSTSIAIAILVLCFNVAACADDSDYVSGLDWRAYNGSQTNSHFSTLRQIDRENVARLKKVWEYRLVDDGLEVWYSFNPLIVDGRMYVASNGGALAALDPATGRKLWSVTPSNPTHNLRGASYWRDPREPASARVFFVGGEDLYAVDATTGRLVTEFGVGGRIHMGVRVNAPGVLYNDLIILGSSNGRRGDGQIRAYDVRTGQVRWVFRTIPSRGTPEAETWGDHGPEKASGANSWGGMAIDLRRGIVYAGTAQPKVDAKGISFFGGDWEGSNRFSSSVIALRADTGQLVWDFQETHHDIWDLDIPAPPNLVRVKYQGKEIDAVAQVTKRGNTLLLDRDTGTLLYPAQSRAAPRSDVPGEATFPTQQVFSLPEPFAKTHFTEQDVTNLNAAAHDYILGRFKAARTGWFDAPSLQGNIFFGPQGGAEWGGASFDPGTHMLYVNSNHIPWFVQLRKAGQRADENLPPTLQPDIDKLIEEGKSGYTRYCAMCHGVDRNGGGGGPTLKGVASKYSQDEIVKVVTMGQGFMPAVGANLTDDVRKAIAAYLASVDRYVSFTERSETGYQSPYILAMGTGPLLDQEGFPGSKPPWGTLNAINLDTGKIEWRVPLGEYPKLRERGVAPTGTRNFGGSVVTAGGLLFIAATADEKIRAFDTSSGRVLWEAPLPFGGYATPATYNIKGRQYVVIATSSRGWNGMHPGGGAYVAFALDETRSPDQ